DSLELGRRADLLGHSGSRRHQAGRAPGSSCALPVKSLWRRGRLPLPSVPSAIDPSKTQDLDKGATGSAQGRVRAWAGSRVGSRQTRSAMSSSNVSSDSGTTPDTHHVYHE